MPGKEEVTREMYGEERMFGECKTEQSLHSGFFLSGCACSCVYVCMCVCAYVCVESVYTCARRPAHASVGGCVRGGGV